MKIGLISDIHAEFGSNVFVPDSADIDLLVVAGDTYSGDWLVEFVAQLTNKDIPILFVTGNHDYYGFDIVKRDEQILSDLAELTKDTRLHFLGGSTFVYKYVPEDILFVGNTMWSEVDVHPNAYSLVNDSVHISTHPEKIGDIARRQKDMFDLASHFPSSQMIAVSHFLPTFDCVHPKFKTFSSMMLNDYFVSPVAPDTYEKYAYWLFGHTHERVDRSDMGCRFLCNPHGYTNENWPYELLMIDTASDSVSYHPLDLQ